MRIPFGAFDLIEPIGRGGTGEVWRGFHRSSDTPVACKIVDVTRLGPGGVAAVRREVQMVCGLHHPGIVQVFDYGSIDERTERMTSSHLVAGSPAYVMELAAGSLAHARIGSWEQVRASAIGMLDALAHAHARGIVHLDLKPANVLLHESGGLKLADFGISRWMSAETGREQMEGTLSYMAPEQLDGRWRDFGPWTDFFALGCIVWRTVYGEKPFPGLDRQKGPASPPPPRFPVPTGLEEWARRALSHSTADRFSCAADAAHALELLQPPIDEEMLGVSVRLDVEEPPTLVSGALDATEVSDLLDHDEPTATEGKPPRLNVATGTHAAVTLTGSVTGASGPVKREGALPTWRLAPPISAAAELSDVGLGIFGLREVPFVDRDGERDLLWSALERVWCNARPEAVILSGPSGSGKSRLVEWIARRAHELGLVRVLKASHASGGGKSDGIRPMLLRHLRCSGLDRPATYARIEQETGDPDLSAVIASLLHPEAEDADDGVRTIRFTAQPERHTAIAWLFTQLSEERPLLVWLDDAHWGPAAVALTQRVLQLGRLMPSSVLILLTSPDEAGGEALAGLAELEAVSTCRVTPLADPDADALVQRLLPLDPALAAQVSERAGGHPLFSIQLVGDWVSRGLLVPGPNGFRVRTGASVELPDDLHRLLRDRLTSITDARTDPEAAAHALELAAALGQVVDPDEWARACEAAETVVPWDLLDSVINARLATYEGEGWGFVHGMLRESLLKTASNAGRLKRHHGACARGLLASPGPEAALRRARHLLESGDAEAALPLLIESANRHWRNSDYGPLPALAVDCRAALAALGAQADARSTAAVARVTATAHFGLGNWAAAISAGIRAADLADRAGAPELAVNALTALGSAAWRTGAGAEALEVWERAAARAEGLDDPRLRATAFNLVATGLRLQGDLPEAGRWLDRALSEARRADDELSLLKCRRERVELLRFEEKDREARVLGKELLATAARLGARFAAAALENVLGDLARSAGELDAAGAHYRRALEGHLATAPAEAPVVELNLALVALLSERAAAARERLRGMLDRGVAPAYGGAAHLTLVWCAALENDWAAWDEHAAAAEALFGTAGWSDPDAARVSRGAGDAASAAGEPERARWAWRFAADQWTKLGRDEVAAAVRKLACPDGSG